MLRESTDAEGNTVAHAYDSLDREVLLTDPDLRRVATVYDAVGRTACTWRGWNSSQPPTSCAWDPATYAANGSRGPLRYVQYSYTANGNRKSVQDANNNLTDYAYDGHGRLAFTLFPDPATGARCSVPGTITSSTTPTCSGEQTYEQSSYDANDNRLTLRTRRADTLSWTYDALNRIQTKAVTELPTVSYGYNLLNEPTALTSPVLGAIQAHSITYGYDGAGRKTYEENLLGGILGRVGYEYDPAGNRTKTLWPDGYFVSYQYDAANRMQYARENGVQELAYYDYDPLARRRELRLAGQSSNRITYTYEIDSNLDVLTHTLNATSVTLDYGYNKSGQIRTIDANDVFYLPSPSDSSTSFVADKLNRYASIAGQASSYDNNGNLLTWFPSAGRHTYTYDAENRLRTAAINGSATASIRYDYDPLGRRLSKVVNGITTFYLLDGDEEIAEYNGAGTMLRRFVTGPGVDDRIAAVEGNAISSPPKTYYHVNHQGSVIAMSDAAGNTSACAAGVSCQRLAYDEYGLLGAGSAATGQPYRYTGRRFDAETGLYYYRARYYSPELGRFLQTDPIGYEDDVNLYAYTRNDPLNLIDPLGEAPGEPFKTAKDAGADAIRFINPRSIEANKEYGGAIYRDPKTGNQYATQPVVGNRDSVSIPGIPEGTELTGDYHTHGDYSTEMTVPGINGTKVKSIVKTDKDSDSFSSDDFSDRDIAKADSIASTNPTYEVSMLGTPSGQIKLYDPNTKKPTVVEDNDAKK